METSFSNQFESLLFKRFFIPGIIIGIFLTLLICIPTGLNLSLLTRPIGGPPGIAIQAGMIPCVILVLAFMLVACVYVIILLCKYFKRSTTFLDSARRFLVFSSLLLLGLDFIAVLGWIEFVRWNYVDILNLPVVIGLSGFALIMTIVFMYWTIRIYRHQSVRFFSWKTIEGIGLFISVLVLITITFLLLI